MESTTTEAAETLRRLTKTARYRNGRMDVNWVSRAQMPRWKMMRLDGTWYERRGLDRLLRRRPPPEVAPVGRRQLTARELTALRDPNPWTLFPRQ